MECLVPSSNDLLKVAPLDRAANSIRVETPELLNPIEPATVWAGA
jgi:hypothetical protein